MTIKRTDELEPGDVVQAAGRWRIVRTRTAAGEDWDLALDPPPIEAPPGPLRRPASEKWFIREDGADMRALRDRLEMEGPGGPNGVGFRANVGRRGGKSSAIPEPGMGFGDMVVEFNPLTGDLTVTGVALVDPISPGKIRLSSKRRSGEMGVGVSGLPK